MVKHILGKDESEGSIPSLGPGEHGRSNRSVTKDPARSVPQRRAYRVAAWTVGEGLCPVSLAAKASALQAEDREFESHTGYGVGNECWAYTPRA